MCKFICVTQTTKTSPPFQVKRLLPNSRIEYQLQYILLNVIPELSRADQELGWKRSTS